MSKFQFSFDDSEDCKLYISSDWHLNHAKEFMWGKRGYKSAKDHTDSIIDTINQTCRPQDICLHLGDFCLNTHPAEVYSLIDRIHCKQWWLKGNHNNPWEKKYQLDCYTTFYNDEPACHEVSSYFSPEMIGYKWYGQVEVWGPYLEFVWNKQPCTFFHFPMAVWNQMHHGAWSLCGHSHYSYPLSRADNFEVKQLDCGWEGHSKPLSFQEIQKIMNKKKITKKDHHDRDIN